MNKALRKQVDESIKDIEVAANQNENVLADLVAEIESLEERIEELERENSDLKDEVTNLESQLQ